MPPTLRDPTRESPEHRPRDVEADVTSRLFHQPLAERAGSSPQIEQRAEPSGGKKATDGGGDGVEHFGRKADACVKGRRLNVERPRLHARGS